VNNVLKEQQLSAVWQINNFTHLQQGILPFDTLFFLSYKELPEMKIFTIF